MTIAKPGFIWMMVACLSLSLLSVFASESTNRPSTWAQKMTYPGLPNFYLVTTNLYRGAQPTADGMKKLKDLGVKTVISLRVLRSDERAADSTGLARVNLAMAPWHITERAAVNFLKAATATNNQPVFVHCERGADRTGAMCAMYRIAVCGWTKEEAIAEMKDGGFHFSPAWKNIVTFIENADISKIRRRAGLPEIKRAGIVKD